MTPATVLLMGLGLCLGYVNGANDVSKGIATLVGSGVTDYRRAILWGALCTGAGSILGMVAAKAMLATFGSGLLAAGTTPTLAAATATLIGAAACVLIATRVDMPVSTTHAIVGALAGVGALAYGIDGVRWSTMGEEIVVPLLLSPVVSLAAVVALLRSTRGSGREASAGADCLCAEVQPVVLAASGVPGGAVASFPALGQLRGQFVVATGTAEVCAAERPRAVRLTLDQAHWLTSGATSFARGLNDTPKMVALVIAALALDGSRTSTPLLFALVATGIVAGSLVAGRRVTHLLAEKVTPMNHREGFTANLVTSLLVGAGAVLGLPMSTTHVASGGIMGAGAQRASLDKKTLRDIALAWLLTLPAGALLGMAAYTIGRLAGA